MNRQWIGHWQNRPSNMKSNWVGVTRAVLQRYWIQPCSASSLMIWMMGTVYLQKFADYTKLVEVADTSEGRAAFQRDINRQEK